METGRLLEAEEKPACHPLPLTGNITWALQRNYSDEHQPSLDSCLNITYESSRRKMSHSCPQTWMRSTPPPFKLPLWRAALSTTHGTPNFLHPCSQQRVEISKDEDGMDKMASTLVLSQSWCWTRQPFLPLPVTITTHVLLVPDNSTVTHINNSLILFQNVLAYEEFTVTCYALNTFAYFPLSSLVHLLKLA